MNQRCSGHQTLSLRFPLPTSSHSTSTQQRCTKNSFQDGLSLWNVFPLLSYSCITKPSHCLHTILPSPHKVPKIVGDPLINQQNVEPFDQASQIQSTIADGLCDIRNEMSFAQTKRFRDNLPSPSYPLFFLFSRPSFPALTMNHI
jgi:hypothetical protein